MLRVSSGSNSLSNPEAKVEKAGLKQRNALRSQSSRIALRATMGFVAVVGFNMLAPQQARADCLIAANIVCDGPVPDAFHLFTNFPSLTYQNGETNAATDGVAVVGGVLAPTVGVAVDATSAITASKVGAPNNGAALFISNDFGGISTTTPFGSGINGNLTSTVGQGLVATTNNAAGNIIIVQGATSTISGLTTGLLATVKINGIIDINALGTVTGASGISAQGLAGTGGITITGNKVTATAGTAIIAEQFSTAVSNNAVTVTTLAGGLIKASGGSGIVARNQLNGSGGITIDSNAAIQASGGNGIFAVRAGASSGDLLVNSNAAISSGAGGPGTLSSGILAAADPGANGNVTVNLKADIGTGIDRTINDGLTARSGGAANNGNVNVNLTNASIFARNVAVAAQNFGNGNVTVIGTGTGLISSQNATGLVAQIANAGKPGNILIDVTQDVEGKTGGIFASTPGSGNISVTAGNVTTSNGNAINAATTGTGAVSVLGKGNVSSVAGIGIFATIDNAANASNIIVNRSGGDIKGTIGVFARILNGSGGIAVTTGGNVTGTAGDAITAQLISTAVSNNAVTVTTLAGGVIKANAGTGISVRNQLNGSGGITIDSNAAIQASGGNGIFAVRAGTSSGDLLINSNAAITSGRWRPRHA